MSCSSSVWENKLPWEAVGVVGRAALHVHLVCGFNLLHVREYTDLRENSFFVSKYVGLYVALDGKSCCSPLWYFKVIALCLLG